MTAKLPEQFRKAPKRRLRDVSIGETVHLLFTDMVVDQQGDCFLDPDARVQGKESLSTIEVTRKQDGYHCAIRSGFHWEQSDVKTGSFLPVSSIEEKPDSDLWGKLRGK